MPVRPDIPPQVLEDCVPSTVLPENITVRDLETWAENLTIALEVCNVDKQKLREALTTP